MSAYSIFIAALFACAFIGSIAVMVRSFRDYADKAIDALLMGRDQ